MASCVFYYAPTPSCYSLEECSKVACSGVCVRVINVRFFGGVFLSFLHLYGVLGEVIWTHE